MSLSLPTSFITTIALVAIGACGDEHTDDHGHAGEGGSHSHGDAAVAECEAIIEACHYKDTGDPGAVNSCHEIGHANEKEACIAAGTDTSFDGMTCPEVCVKAPDPGDAGVNQSGTGGESGQGGAPGAGHGGHSG